MQLDHDLIWILDNDPEMLTFYRQSLGLHYGVKGFDSIDSLVETLASAGVEPPRLLIADPENVSGNFTDAFVRSRESAARRFKLPEFLICSRLDDLDLIRFYLKAGARDYLVKPLRPNELVAKVEKALQQISNREILILRNELDGVQITDLTFREHQLLTIFLSRPDRCVHRDQLYDAIWTRVTVNKKTLDVHVFNLRRKLRPYGYDIVSREQTFFLEKRREKTETSDLVSGKIN